MSQSRAYPSHPIPGVGILIRDKDKILLIKRAANPDKGLWSVPGGLVEVGETVEETAVREAFEETCLRVELIKRLGVVDKIERDSSGEVLYHFIIIQYLAEVRSGMLCARDDALEVIWVPLDELTKYELTDSLREFLIQINLYPI